MAIHTLVHRGGLWGYFLLKGFYLRKQGHMCGQLLPEGFKPGGSHEGYSYDAWMVEEVEV